MLYKLREKAYAQHKLEALSCWVSWVDLAKGLIQACTAWISPNLFMVINLSWSPSTSFLYWFCLEIWPWARLRLDLLDWLYSRSQLFSKIWEHNNPFQNLNNFLSFSYPLFSPILINITTPFLTLYLYTNPPVPNSFHIFSSSLYAIQVLLWISLVVASLIAEVKEEEDDLINILKLHQM